MALSVSDVPRDPCQRSPDSSQRAKRVLWVIKTKKLASSVLLGSADGKPTEAPYPALMAWYWFLPIALGVVGVAGIGVHLLVRRLGDEGLIDYIPQSPTKKTVGSAMLNFGVIYDPSLEHVIEFEQSGDLTAQGSSEPFPPEPDPSS
jgi:hypothetical protein